MNKIFIISLLACLGYGASCQAQLNDYSTYQLAFRKGGKIITIQPGLNAATTSVAHERANQVSQQLIFKRHGDAGMLIASVAAPHKFLKRVKEGDADKVTFAAYDSNHSTDYLWIVHIVIGQTDPIVSTNQGGRMTGLLSAPDDASRAATLQADGSIQMSIIDYSLVDDPHRLYVSKKTSPGDF
ncbi:hypothetical protein [Microscilla marina]|uniref:Lipoprotein n=1 Tax=Microscilla marina ATCC 23134 TaxID=313606 RepID=A1ZVW6_MICM2|nr:hypothetical protein [Microscilla marina]EAY25448.1 hypothetical protein M23134_00802 [Microscilla marina ATCC 23134]